MWFLPRVEQAVLCRPCRLGFSSLGSSADVRPAPSLEAWVLASAPMCCRRKASHPTLRLQRLTYKTREGVNGFHQLEDVKAGKGEQWTEERKGRGILSCKCRGLMFHDSALLGSFFKIHHSMGFRVPTL